MQAAQATAGTRAGAPILRPHDTVTIRLTPWKRLAHCFDGNTEPTLFLDHLPMMALPTTGRFVEVVQPAAGSREAATHIAFSFRLDKPSKGEAAWRELLYRDWVSPTTRWVKVGLGVGGGEIVTLDQVQLAIGNGSPSWAWTALVVSIMSVLLVALGTRALEDRRGGFKSVSLSRLTLSCWVATTTAVVIVVWRHSQALPSFSDGGLAFMLAASGLGTGFSTWMDNRRNADNAVATNLFEDLLCDEDGLALHRLQALIFNGVVLYVVWADLITYGTVAQVNASWSALLGASTLTYLFGRGSEAPAIPEDLAKRPLPLLQTPLRNVSADVVAKLRQLTGSSVEPA